MKKHIAIFWVLGLFVMAAPHLALTQSMEMTSAKLYIQQNEWDKAIHWLQEALKKKPDNAEAHYLLGQGYGLKGRYADMVAEFAATEANDTKKKYEKDIAQQRQRFFAESFNGGVKAFNEQNYDLAAYKFADVILIDPKQASAYQNLAIAYRQIERNLQQEDFVCEGCSANEHQWDAAAVRCRDQSTGESVTFCCCGKEEVVGQLYGATVNTYESLIKIEPDSAGNYLALSDYYKSRYEFYRSNDDSAQARAELEKGAAVLARAKERQLNDSRILSDLAISLDFMGRSDEAFAIYEQAIAADPQNKDLRFNLGRLFLMRQDYQNAIAHFEKVLETHPDDFETNFNIGISYLKIGEGIEKDIQQIEEEATSKKQKPEAAKIESMRAEAKKNFEAAVPYLEKAVELQPQESAVWFNLGVGYTRVGANEKAKDAFAKADAMEKN